MKTVKILNRQATWLIMIFLTILFLTILGASKATAQNDFNIGYEVVIDNEWLYDFVAFRNELYNVLPVFVLFFRAGF